MQKQILFFLLLTFFIGQNILAQSIGSITMERFENLPNGSLNTLFDAPNYPDNPDFTTELTSFEIPTDIANYYGVRVSGLLHAPETGTYYFWIASDDFSRLDLSTDESQTNVNEIASIPGWTNSREWDKYARQASIGIDLVAGQRYAILAYVKENIGSDNMAVGWRKPSDGPGSVPSEIIPGTVLSPFGTPVTGITLDNGTVSLAIGGSTTLNATVVPMDASNNSVVWTSSNPAIASVNALGIVDAIAEGTATITATTVDGGFTASTNITVSGSGGPSQGTSVWSEANTTASYTGEVAIGRATVPIGYKLAVEGFVRAREVRVDQDTWPDYVFDKGYDLPTLEDIQKHIQEKGHLPNIPSAQEVKANGVELGKMNKSLLEKIEELTLYLFQQNERIKVLEKQLNK